MGCGASSQQQEQQRGGGEKKSRDRNGSSSNPNDEGHTVESDNPTAAYPKQTGDGSAPRTREDKKSTQAALQPNGGSSSSAKYRNDDGAGGAPPEAPSEVAGPLSQSMLVDLRTRSAKESGSSVQRWVDAIATPGENDSVEVYDPIRRHFLSMESLHHKSGENHDM